MKFFMTFNNLKMRYGVPNHRYRKSQEILTIIFRLILVTHFLLQTSIHISYEIMFLKHKERFQPTEHYVFSTLGP